MLRARSRQPAGAIVVAAVILVIGSAPVGAQDPGTGEGLSTADLSGATTPEDLAEELAGSGVTVSDVSFAGSGLAGGTFASGDADIVGFDDGIVLGSGAVADVAGPNQSDGWTTAHDLPGDSDLDALLAETGHTTLDATVLEFDFVPDKDEVTFRYVFSSEEYDEFVGSPYDDVFGFFVNGTNCAVVPDAADRVSVNTINSGNPQDEVPASNPDLHRRNTTSSGAPIDTEMDGLTVPLLCRADVVPNEVNRLKLAIADTSDHILDSNVFLEAGSFTTDPPACDEHGLAVVDGTGVLSGTVHDSVEPLLGTVGEQASELDSLEGDVHDLNCDVVVPLEDQVDGLLGGLAR